MLTSPYLIILLVYSKNLDKELFLNGVVEYKPTTPTLMKFSTTNKIPI